MGKNNSFNCVLVGADTLLIECGDYLLSQGHRVESVVTREQRVRQWALSKSIHVVDLDGDYASEIGNISFDYLFSITHLEIISDNVLNLAKKQSINFHDGPLPRYAGINTPIWALINQEREHGITWHVMEPGVDKGDILEQNLFEIDKDETGLSINTKCFAAALESFPKLVNDLAHGATNPVSQDFSKRTYFPKNKRPSAAGFIDWGQGASSIEALVRALDFGDYNNPIATVKTLLNDEVVIVQSAVARDEQLSGIAGQILAIDESEIKVATAVGVLSITKLRGSCGTLFSAGEFAHRKNLVVGNSFSCLSSENDEALTSVNSLLCKHEGTWQRLLANLKPVELPNVKVDASSNSQVEIIAAQLESDSNNAIAAIAVTLSRLSQQYVFDLGFSCDAYSQGNKLLQSLVNPSSLLHLNLDKELSLGELSVHISDIITKTCASGTWLKDAVLRDPALRDIPEFTHNEAILPIYIVSSNTADLTMVKGSALTIFVTDAGAISLSFDSAKVDRDTINSLIEQFKLAGAAISRQPQLELKDVALISEEEQHKILFDWNDTHVEFNQNACIHTLFESQVLASPDTTAVVFEGKEYTYSQLNERANQLANYLISQGASCDAMVGVNIVRSLDLMVATLAVLKSGAAYVPLDPDFPADRLDYMIEDANMDLIISQSGISSALKAPHSTIIHIDSDWGAISQQPTVQPDSNVTSDNLAYVIYTSGSTGKPKGVMVEHRNAVNFFVGMDERIPYDDDSAWLAVTSLSFDISVLELFWTLTRGLKVVIYKDNTRIGSEAADPKIQNKGMDFGLFMWGNDDAEGKAKYRLMLEGAKYFDQNGFNSVWTPERHFHAFGGPYPNPSVTSAALAVITENVAIRSGSTVSPLHHSVRIAEEWSVVDNLSDGRVGLSFAAGWQPNDFIIKPENHANNKKVMLEQIDQVKRLWRGESIKFKNPMGDMVAVQSLPRPVQKELPVWLTTAGNPESYRAAGELGVNVLTHLLGQSVEELAEKISIYRESRAKAGHDAETGNVTLMLHTFVGSNPDEVRELVREPMKDYLRSSIKLVMDFAWSFPAFKRPEGQEENPDDIDLKSLSDEDTETILDFAFDRYFETSGLFGTPEMCMSMINRCKAAGVDEIGCLVDFGVDTDLVAESFPLIKQVRDMANTKVISHGSNDELSFASQVKAHKITHFQCTPSMARMFTFSDEAKHALSSIKHMMVGGEALPVNLAQELKAILTGHLSNMYGPTETTIWSTTSEISNPNDITVGRQIANTKIYILDQNMQPVPTGSPGDLYIGGAGVVRGYLNRKELTDERFIANPFVEGHRIYMTGDVAKYRQDGTIEFLGRSDFQVKIRGYRIELGEIENQLATHAMVKECVILLREDNPGDQRLIAYVIAQADMNFDSHMLKVHQREQLPEYMVPAEYVALDQFPLTPNGKIDRLALPSPHSLKPAAAVEYVAPEDEMESVVVQVWSNALAIEKVGVNDNFFDIGGHSLLVVKVHAQLKGALEQTVSLTDLYAYPTIKSLCDFLRSGGSGKSLQKSTDRAARRRQMMGRGRRR